MRARAWRLARALSTGLAIGSAVFALAGLALVLAQRAVATEHHFAYYVETPPIEAALSYAVLIALVVVPVVAAVRRSDVVRAAVLWPVSVVDTVLAIAYAFGFSVLSVPFICAGLFGLGGAAVASIEARSPLRTLGLSALTTAVTCLALRALGELFARL